MEREEFLDFIRYYCLAEKLCGNDVPILTELEYARIYDDNNDQWIKVPGNTFVLMFNESNLFTINTPINLPIECKYYFENKKRNHLRFLTTFLEQELILSENVQYAKIINNECLKIVGNFEGIKSSIIHIKCRESMYSEMDNHIIKMLQI